MPGVPARDRLDLLTHKELQCLRLVAENLSSKQIGRELGISQASVDTHLRHVRQKLGIDNRYDAVRLLEARAAGHAPDLAKPPSGPHLLIADENRFGVLLPPLEHLGPAGRLLIIAAGAILAALLFGLLLSALAAL